MRLDPEDCWRRLSARDHGILATVHPDRGVDAVPVVFAAVEGGLVVPVDTVKAKTTTRLQRLANLAADPRCVLVVDHYDDDWSALWWVRVHATATVIDGGHPGLERFEQYRAPGSVVATIVLSPTQLTGWSAQ